jgi:pimeloyl-ACP methyl ester carboxylesterase
MIPLRLLRPAGRRAKEVACGRSGAYNRLTIRRLATLSANQLPNSMPYLHLDRQRLYYTRTPWLPAPGLPALLLVHGAGGSRLDWPGQLRRMDGANVFALDLPGHGRSSQPGRASIDGYAGDAAALVQALALEKVVVAGHSMGGAIAMTLGLQRPSWLAGLVLIGTGARLRVTDAILNQILPHFDTAVDTITRFYWAENAPPPLVESGRQALRQNDPKVLYDDYVACNQFDVLGRLGAIEVPALVISGTADPLTPTKYGQYLAGQIRDSRLTLVDGASHMMMLEQPAVVAAAVEAFIQEIS